MTEIIINENVKNTLETLLLTENKNNIGLIYGHYQPFEHKWYVGQTSNLDPNKRWFNGNGYTKNNSNTKFSNKIKELGWDSFKHYILEYTTLDKLNSAERKWVEKLDSFKNGYNSTIGGETIFAEDIKLKISTSRKGKCVGSKNPNYNKVISEETRNRLRISHIGKRPSLETREKMSLSHIGHKVPESVIQRITLLNKGKHTIPHFGEDNPASKKVYVYKNNLLYATYNTITDAAKSFLIGKNKLKEFIKNCNLVQFNDNTESNFVFSFNQDISNTNTTKIIYKRKSYKRNVILYITKDDTDIDIKKFDSAIEGAAFLNLKTSSHIISCCKGKRYSAGIYNDFSARWRYSD